VELLVGLEAAGMETVATATQTAVVDTLARTVVV